MNFLVASQPSAYFSGQLNGNKKWWTYSSDQTLSSQTSHNRSGRKSHHRIQGPPCKTLSYTIPDRIISNHTCDIRGRTARCHEWASYSRFSLRGRIRARGGSCAPVADCSLRLPPCGIQKQRYQNGHWTARVQVKRKGTGFPLFWRLFCGISKLGMQLRGK